MKKLSTIIILLLVVFSIGCYTAFKFVNNKKGNVSIQWYGHSSFGISDAEGIAIVTDPYAEGIGYTFPKVSTKLLTLSHDHFDHNNTAALEKYSQCIKETGSFNAQDIKVTGIASFHDEEMGAQRGPNTIYTYEFNKIRICHLGDLGHLLNNEQITAIGKVDILMIPVGGLYTIDPQNAAKVIEQLNPKIVIPMHYKTDVLPEEFGPVEKIDSFTSIMKGWKIEKPSTLEISKTKLNKLKEKTIIILPFK